MKKPRLRIGAYKESTWETIVWGIIRVIFVIMIIVEVILTIVSYAERKIGTEVTVDNGFGRGLRYPNLMLCPLSPVNASSYDQGMQTFLIAHTTPNILKTVPDITNLRSSGKAEEYSMLLADKVSSNYSYTKEIRKRYQALGYQCESVISRCRTDNDHGPSVDCCSRTSIMPTYFGPCMFMELEALPIEQYIPGQFGGMRLEISRQMAPDDPGVRAFLIDRWNYYPKSAVITLMPDTEYYLSIRAKRQFVLDTGKKEWRDAKEWHERWDKEFDKLEGKRRGAGWAGEEDTKASAVTKRRDCVFECQMKVVAERCGCVPFYADLGTDITLSHKMEQDQDGREHQVCDLNRTLDCVVEIARNASTQLVANQRIVGDDLDTLESAGLNVNTTRKSFKQRLTEQWDEFKRTWWKLGYSEPNDCVSQCARGDVVTTFDSMVGSFPLKATAGKEVPANVLHLAYVDLSMTVYKEHYAMTFSEMLWVMGTSVAIWVVLYHIIKCSYDCIKQACQCNKKTATTAEGPGDAERGVGGDHQNSAGPYGNGAHHPTSRPTTGSRAGGRGEGALEATARPPMDHTRVQTGPRQRGGPGGIPADVRSVPSVSPSQLPPIQQPVGNANEAYAT